MMTDTLASARASAQACWALAKVERGDLRDLYLEMAAWWGLRAAELEAKQRSIQPERPARIIAATNDV